jgi:type IV pilus assembly protein PilP
MRRGALLLAGVSLLLAACSGREHEDLRQWMDAATRDIKARVPPLPQAKAYEAVAYEGAGLLDPFRPSKIEPERKSGGGGLQPDFNRAREPLEAYPLESLRYVGVMIRNKQAYAIIQADGALHQVRSGNYMGQNFGVVTRINESEVSLRELVQDPTGDWVERTSGLQLQDKDGRK